MSTGLSYLRTIPVTSKLSSPPPVNPELDLESELERRVPVIAVATVLIIHAAGLVSINLRTV